MKLKKKLINIYLENGNKTSEDDVKFYFLWNALLMKAEKEGVSLRQSIRDYVEDIDDEIDIDFEDERLDVFYLSPIFEDLRVDEDKDIYYYEYYNTQRQARFNDDYVLSIKNFQRILQDNDISSMMMSVFKVYDYLMNLDNDNYNDRVIELMKASNYLLECILKV